MDERKNNNFLVWKSISYIKFLWVLLNSFLLLFVKQEEMRIKRDFCSWKRNSYELDSLVNASFIDRLVLYFIIIELKRRRKNNNNNISNWSLLYGAAVEQTTTAKVKCHCSSCCNLNEINIYYFGCCWCIKTREESF